MKYEPFAELLKPYWDLPLSGVPAALSTRTIAEDVYALWGWDALGPEGRQSVAESHDAMHDPARKGERESIRKLTQEMDLCLKSIALWETMHPQSITEAGAKEAKLATLKTELAALQQRLFAPSRDEAAVQPTTDLRPVTHAPVVALGALDDTPSTNWRHLIQAEAYQHWIRIRATGCNPSVFSICDHMATWCITKNIKGGKGQNPRAGTIRNTVLGAGHWTPPHHSIAEAQKHIAQIAQTAQTKVTHREK